MNMCERCPRRDTARLFRALGETAAAEEIERQGCPWWWAVVGTEGDSRGVRIKEQCGVELLPNFLAAYGSKILEATEQVGKTKNEIAAGLGRIATAAEVAATAAVLRPVVGPTWMTENQMPRPADELAAVSVDVRPTVTDPRFSPAPREVVDGDRERFPRHLIGSEVEEQQRAEVATHDDRIHGSESAAAAPGSGTADAVDPQGASA